MVRLSDLPEIAIEQILRWARGRSIASTNKYARVCRQWRDAGDEAEPLQLFMDLTYLSEQDLARASSWLAKYGQHVDVLVIGKEHAAAQRRGLGLFASTAPVYSQLRRLEVLGQDSLAHLVPALKQLPQLQHLGASVSIACGCGNKWWCDKYVSLCRRTCRNFIKPNAAGWEEWDVPDMEQLCPQLTSLHLMVYIDGGRGAVPSMSPLLSPGLQQLSLSNKKWDPDMVLYASDLQHLMALQQLTLDGFFIGEEHAAGLAEMSALQQLRVYNAHALSRDVAGLTVVAPKMTEYEVCVHDEDTGSVTGCVHLTRLVLRGTLPEGAAAILAALTGLCELGLLGDVTDSTVEMVEQVAGVVQLRSLQLEGYGDDDLPESLAQCTQLTSLVLLVDKVRIPTPPNERSNCVAVRVPMRYRPIPWAGTLQQLTGLQSLTVSEQVVVDEQGAWLAALTQLTRMCVILGRIEQHGTDYDTETTVEQQQGRALLYHTKGM